MNAAITKKIDRLLHEVFELKRLRPGQREVIEAVLRGEDVLALMPTGAGKSLCYQLPALMIEGMTLVISPLISLMKDQADKIKEKGLRGAVLNSQISEREQRESLKQIECERSDFIFATPERLTDAEFIETLGGKKIDFVVIDEAHCISAWGHDFRPAFLELRQALRRLGNPPILALTATATPEVIEDIKQQLGCPQMRVIENGIFRSNLHFTVVHTTSDSEKRRHLVETVSACHNSKIIYCATVKAVDEITRFLRAGGFSVEAYHGRLSAKLRAAAQDRFMSGATATIVATNAFGMGIDKPDIRSVTHWQMPGTLEAYYQEAGRAGRDGIEARSILLYDTRDRRVQQFFLGGRYPSADDLTALYTAAEDLCGVEPSVCLEQLQETLGAAMSKSKLRVALSLLKELKILRERRGTKYELIKTDLSADEIKTAAEIYISRATRDREKLEQMMLYAQSTSCRWQQLAKYFRDPGDDAGENTNCDICDNCINLMSQQIAPIPTTVNTLTPAEEQKLLANLQSHSSNAWDISIGETVKVPKHGIAKVVAVSGDKIEVRLSGGEAKTFKQSFLQKI